MDFAPCGREWAYGAKRGWIVCTNDEPCPHCAEIAKLREELAEARAIIRLVIPNCEWLHHNKKHQHHPIGQCPVQKMIEEYDFDPDGTIARSEANE